MDLVIFDLDGTLIDSRLDLAQAVNAMLRHLGRTTLANERVYSYVGNGAPMLVRRAMGENATEAQLQEGLEYFLEYYRDHSLDNTVPYPGVRESVERLHDAGIDLAVLTNKPVRISRAIIEGLGMGPFFRQVYGGNSFDFKKPHPIGVETLVAECGVTRDKTLMVGDSSVDVQTARNAGVMCAAVTYGFQPESLADPAPDLLMDRMDAVADWVLAQKKEITR
jgi:phosphoglycolate phosphatase